MQRSAEIVPLDEERSRRAGEEAARAAGLDTVGAMLRAAREDAELSVDRVSQAINVKPERLIAIEKMDLAVLPSPPYTLGFVRAYGELLGLPVDPLVARYREQAGWVRSPTAPVVSAPRRADLGRSRETSLILVLLIAGFIAWCGWQIIQSSGDDAPAAEVEGFPISDRTEQQQVTYEVDTSLAAPSQETATVSAPALLSEASGEAAMDDPAVASEGLARLATEEEATLDRDARRRPSLIPLVVMPAVAFEPERQLEVTAPARQAPAEPLRTSRADALNEQALVEAVAARSSEPAERLGEQDVPPLPAPRDLTTEPVRGVPTTPVMPELVPATLVSTVEPVYPSRCERGAMDEETVTVTFGVNRLGRVTRPSIAGSTNACFDRAALSAVSRFGFDPATEAGRPVATGGRTTRIVFRKP